MHRQNHPELKDALPRFKKWSTSIFQIRQLKLILEISTVTIAPYFQDSEIPLDCLLDP